MKEIAKGTIELIEDVIRTGVNANEISYIKRKIDAEYWLEEINKRKSVSDSPIKFFNLLLSSILLIKNDSNFKAEVYVDTISKLTYNRYLIKKEIS